MKNSAEFVEVAYLFCEGLVRGLGGTNPHYVIIENQRNAHYQKIKMSQT